MLQDPCLAAKWEETINLLDEINFDDISLILPSPPVSKRAGEKRKRVRFASAKPAFIPTISRKDFTEKEKSNTWWSVEECAEFRNRAKVIASYTRKGARLFTRKTLEIPFETACAFAAESEETISIVMQDPSMLVVDLTEWSCRSNARRGLEHRVVHCCLRSRTASKQRKAVVSSLERGCALAQIAQAHSRPSRLFARMIGFGDAVVVEGTPEYNSSLTGPHLLHF
jgi:hypothetical protein